MAPLGGGVFGGGWGQKTRRWTGTDVEGSEGVLVKGRGVSIVDFNREKRGW